MGLWVPNMVRGVVGPSLGSGVVIPTFEIDLASNPPSVANLPTSITINGVTVEAQGRWIGSECTVDSWPANFEGATCSATGSGNPTLNRRVPLFGSTDGAVKGNAGKYFIDSGTSIGDLSTLDFAIHIIARPYTTTGRLCGKLQSAPSFNGWQVYNTNSVLAIYCYSGGASVGAQSPAHSSAWGDYWFFCDRSESTAANSLRAYLNGSAGTGVDASGKPDITSTANFGLLGTGGSPCSDDVALVEVFSKAGWFHGSNNPTDWAAFTKTSLAKLCGLIPNGIGSTTTPQTMTRASLRHLEDYDSDNSKTYLLPVKNGWPGVERRAEGVFFWPEQEVDNLAGNSNDAGSWGASNVSVTANSTEAPNLLTQADTLTESGAGSQYHSINMGNENLTATKKYCFSCFVKPSARDWILLRAYETVSAQGHGSAFDVTNGVVGTWNQNINAAGIIGPYHGGFYRCFVTWTQTGTEAVTPYIYLSNADNLASYEGSEAAVIVWGAQLEEGTYPSSQIDNNGAGHTTRVADSLMYKADDGFVNNSQNGTIYAEILKPNADSLLGMVADITDGGSASDRVRLQIDATTDSGRLWMRASGGNNGDLTGTTDVCDGSEHRLQVNYKTNAANLLIDGTQEGTPDSSCDVPNDLDELDVGQGAADSSQLNGGIKVLRIYPKPVKRAI
jgi:hypothetical protein